MKKLAIACAVAAAAVWLVAQNAATPKPLSEIAPAGALLYVEAKNFGALLDDWNQSAEKKTWLTSANHQVFTRSRLYLRFTEIFNEFTAAAGLPPDMAFASSVAGGQSALAIYDINKLEFLYLTRLASARALESALWKARETFTARNAAGVPYYFKGDAKRIAAFAVSGDLLLLATREDALTGALALLRGAAGTPLRREPWFESAVAATAAQGDLRMALNMEKLARAPSFRSYWVQRNVAELSAFSSGVNDLFRSAADVREERVLLRPDPAPAPDASGVAELLPLAANAGSYRVQAEPDPAYAAQRIIRKALNPGPSVTARSKTAPGASIDALAWGSEGDLDSKIDDAPFEPPGQVFRPAAFESLLAANRPRAMLERQSSRAPAGAVFVENEGVVAVLGAADWDANAVREALRAAVEGLYTTAQSGMVWREQGGIHTVDGLARLAMAARGPLLLIGSRREAVEAVLPLIGQATEAQPASYAAGYRLAGELPNYTRMMRLIESPQARAESNEPAFFGENLASLARTLARVREASIVARDDGRQLKQTVIYRLAP